ncbi:Fatty acyl-CoA reductase [Cesiribacter andamanensis AMV16]|uniref:Fatty acyl-CoA reductase n=2 Tax=Cesiribacter TaxID=1133570 RepID=M7NBC1_9BACT|nr:Fatty acyl-CoA reductase [Cesiribacter andamanensis AMV16]
MLKTPMEITTKQAKKGVVVITGASAGVGRATARLFGRKGYDVALLARGEEALEAAKKEIEALGQKARWYKVDVADAQAVEEAAEKIEQELGPIEVWVNNAMNSVFSPVKDMKPEEYKRVTDVTYLGQVYGTLSALKRMRSRNRGSIVFVGSALAYRGIPLQSAYCGAKHAIQGFFDSLRTELLHDDSPISISMVELPALNTTQFGFVKNRLPNRPRPMGKIYQPEVAADAILFAAEHKRREVLVGFPTVQAIVGNKLAPWFADWVLSRTGIKGQQTQQPKDPNQKHNLWEPVPGVHGAHGEFGEKAHEHSTQLWISKHKPELLAGLLLLGGLLTGGLLMTRR